MSVESSSLLAAQPNVLGRNLVIACDGTSNEFGKTPTNVVRLVRVLARDPQAQIIFYDPGVGTLPQQGAWTWLAKKLSVVAGLAFGVGLLGNISDAYRFLMQQWKPGDRIFLFGFSRGAYTVRAFASVLYMFGLLMPDNDNLLPYLLRTFKASKRRLNKGEKKAKAYWHSTDEFRESFARAVPGRDDRRFPIHFCGVWDTVSSVGGIFDPVSFPYTRSNPGITVVHHAVAIDERRCFFRQNLFKQAEKQILSEEWFAGTHCDVGGGHKPRDGGSWRESYLWMLDGAKQAGLLTEPARENAIWQADPVPPRLWVEKLHNSLTWLWWPAEFIPRWPYDAKTKKRRLKFGLGRRRIMQKGAKVHRSVRDRMRDDQPPYHPPNLPGP